MTTRYLRWELQKTIGIHPVWGSGFPPHRGSSLIIYKAGLGWSGAKFISEWQVSTWWGSFRCGTGAVDETAYLGVSQGWGFPGGSVVKNPPADAGVSGWMPRWGILIPKRRKWQPTSRILAWEIPRTEEPGGLQSMGSQRVEHNWATQHQGQAGGWRHPQVECLSVFGSPEAPKAVGGGEWKEGIGGTKKECRRQTNYTRVPGAVPALESPCLRCLLTT